MKKRENFGSQFAFIMAMAGSAIGLGNIWRFPYMVGEYGGAAFILIYIICSVVLSLPIFFCEAIIGRRSRQSAYGAMKKFAPDSMWKLVGVFSVVTAVIIVSYYSVVGGWSLDYLFRSLSVGLKASSQVEAAGIFQSMSSSAFEAAIVFTVFLLTSALIVLGGIRRGIEKFTKLATPALGVLITVIAIYSCTLPGAGEGVRYLIRPDWSVVTPATVAFALGQSFYSLSIGMGCVLVYSSFMKKSENLVAVGGWTAAFDTLFAVIAGFAIMPAVFAAGLEPGSGPSLIFETLPYIFAQMGLESPVLSRIATILFFLSIFIAALTSSISVLEVCVEHSVDHRNIPRKKATVLYFAGAWVLGMLCCLSFGLLDGIKISGYSIFGLCDMLSSNFFMTLIAIAFSIFVGWKMDKSDVWDEFTNGGTLKFNCAVFGVFRFLTRWVAPVLIALIFGMNLFA